ncbi:hypothetical protein PIB30_076464 [Stylosanthes scabra]|uniref:DUF4283 domain-containing protein n=1 Tax=Stylosanthes scabra TaxID=79078 RepID=A0ABU6SSD1_9FABA|nr:hypothetical protein [Stylosanthes scabra]
MEYVMRMEQAWRMVIRKCRHWETRKSIWMVAVVWRRCGTGSLIEDLHIQFLEVRRWTKGETDRSRKFWLEITGLPIHGWSEANMRKIGEVWGRVLGIEMEEGGHYSSFRVLVVANSSPRIRTFATVVIENENFIIFVNEEGGPGIEYGANMERKALSNGAGETTNANRRCDNMINSVGDVAIRPVPIMSGEGSKAAEDEESKVGETEHAITGRDEDSNNWAGVNGPIVGIEATNTSSSPTKTRTLDDDRRTGDVLLEWEEVLYQKPNDMVDGPHEEDTLRDVVETTPCLPNGPVDDLLIQNLDRANEEGIESNSLDVSIPPGFERNALQVLASCEERAPEKRERKKKKHNGSRHSNPMSLKLKDRIKERARKQKETSKKKKSTQTRIREEEEIRFWQSSEDEIENTEEAADDAWWVGTKVGIGTDCKDRARKHLRSKAEEVALAEGAKSQKRRKGRNKEHKELMAVADSYASGKNNFSNLSNR